MHSRNCLAALALAFCVVFLAAARARDAFVVFSGGGTPLTNNYSQYLQARELDRFLRERYPDEAVWTFFGAGNRDGQPVVLADVRKQYKAPDGTILESWLPGPLPHNRPADKESFLGTLRDEVLPTVRDGGTLYLFVGDHGTQQKDGAKESLITLWQMKRNENGGWRTDPKEELSVSELREVLAAGLGRGRIVFFMTQCHSGGFHHLGVTRFAAPPSEWFAGVMPDWAGDETSPVIAGVAGFTATNEDTLAAGCDPDPDPDRWAGYERYLPEAILGRDLFTGEPNGIAASTFAAAHRAAVLVDQTIDRPRSSSEHLLERWAQTIERLLESPETLAPAVRAAAEAYRRDVESGLADGVTHPAFAARREEFSQFVQRLREQNTRVADTLKTGDRAALEKAMGPANRRGGMPSSGPRPPPPLAAQWKDTYRAEWKQAVEAGEIADLTGAALEFEKYLLAAEDRGRDVMFPRSWQNPMLNDLFWRSGYANPATLDPAKAEAVVRWGAERRSRIAAWAQASADEKTRAFGKALQPPAPRAMPPRTLRADIAAERTLFYRRTLAAWKFLATVEAAPALAELHALIALEQGSLPAPTLTR